MAFFDTIRGIFCRNSPPLDTFEEVLQIDQKEATSHVAEVFGPKQVIQSFAVNGEVFRVDIMFATFMRQNNREVIFSLLDAADAAEPLRQVTVNADQLSDNQYYSFCFEPVQVKRGNIYYARIESPQSYFNNCITVRASEAKVLADSVLLVNGKQREQDITFRVFARERVPLIQAVA